MVNGDFYKIVTVGSSKFYFQQKKTIMEQEQKHFVDINKANLRDLIAATSQVILLKLDSNIRLFPPVWPWNLMDDIKKQQKKNNNKKQKQKQKTKQKQ